MTKEEKEEQEEQEKKEKIHKNFNEQINLFFNSKMFNAKYREDNYTGFIDFYNANPHWYSKWSSDDALYFLDDKEKTITFPQSFLRGDEEYDYVFDFSEGSPSKFKLILNIYDRSLGEYKDKNTLTHSNSIEVKKGKYPTYQNALKRVIREAEKKVDSKEIEYLEESIISEAFRGLTSKETTLFNHFGIIDLPSLSKKIYDIANFSLFHASDKSLEIKRKEQKKKKAELSSSGKLGLISENDIKVELKWKLGKTLHCSILLGDHEFEINSEISKGHETEHYLSICEKVIFFISAMSLHDDHLKHRNIRDYFVTFCDKHEEYLLNYLTNDENVSLVELETYISEQISQNNQALSKSFDKETLEMSGRLIFFEDLIVKFLQWEFINNDRKFSKVSLEVIKDIINELNTSTVYEQHILIYRHYIGLSMVWQGKDKNKKDYVHAVNVHEINIQEFNTIYQFVFNNVVAIVKCFNAVRKPQVQPQKMYYKVEENIPINDRSMVELDFLGSNTSLGSPFIKDRFIVWDKDTKTFYGYNGELGLTKSLIPLFKGKITEEFKKPPKTKYPIYVIPRQLLDPVPDYEYEVVVSDEVIFALTKDRSDYYILGISTKIINYEQIKFYKSDLSMMLDLYKKPVHDLVDDEGFRYRTYPPMTNLIKSFYKFDPNERQFYIKNYLYHFIKNSISYSLFTDGTCLFFTTQQTEIEDKSLDSGLAMDLRILSATEDKYDFVESSHRGIILKDNTKVNLQIYHQSLSDNVYLDFFPSDELISMPESLVRPIENMYVSIELDGNFLNDLFHTTQGVQIDYMRIEVKSNAQSQVNLLQYDSEKGVKVVKTYKTKDVGIRTTLKKGYTIQFNYEYIKKYYSSLAKTRNYEVDLQDIRLALGRTGSDPMLISTRYGNDIMPNMIIMPMRMSYDIR